MEVREEWKGGRCGPGIFGAGQLCVYRWKLPRNHSSAYECSSWRQGTRVGSPHGDDTKEAEM